MSGREMKDLMSKLNKAVDLKEGVVTDEFRSAFSQELRSDEILFNFTVGHEWGVQPGVWELKSWQEISDTGQDPEGFVRFVMIEENRMSGQRWIVETDGDLFKELDRKQAEFERKIGRSR